MGYWTAAQLMPRQEALALHCLKLAGYETYLPRLRERRVSRGRRITVTPPLFPGYLFILIQLQWHTARWSPGIAAIIRDGECPAKVSDAVIAEIRGRECGGLIELPKLPGMKIGERVRVTRGPFSGLEGLYSGQSSRQRVEILLRILGASQRVTLPRGDIELALGLELK
jgi:transcriptional antiterminator RfaH